jgi:hypothetical protein
MGTPWPGHYQRTVRVFIHGFFLLSLTAVPCPPGVVLVAFSAVKRTDTLPVMCQQPTREFANSATHRGQALAMQDTGKEWGPGEVPSSCLTKEIPATQART